ncbi:ribonuclease H2, subunit C [Favolaschia claudopus]|uniref:Ribonuclease H2, subunit C n=1 Tax=Favolaschia claudopus TaxID=2862362 RepID=A0AAW0BWW9_9AGAR
MAAPTLKIAPISDVTSLPHASPNLMPFHIAHDGPAPIATYFLVEAAKEQVAQPSLCPIPVPDVEMEPVVVPADADATFPEKDDPPADPNLLVRRVTDATTRFIATFRGRTMQGLKVPLPASYSGLVMKSASAAASSAVMGRSAAFKKKNKKLTKGKPRGNNKSGRVTRSAMRDEDDENEEDDDFIGAEDEERCRTLMPTAQFDSLVVWHPDIPVDSARDEYLRSLSEWIRLANEIHRPIEEE